MRCFCAVPGRLVALTLAFVRVCGFSVTPLGKPQSFPKAADLNIRGFCFL